VEVLQLAVHLTPVAHWLRWLGHHKTLAALLGLVVLRVLVAAILPLAWIGMRSFRNC
jgi:hypothetical protein